jgi:hypothetical protein
METTAAEGPDTLPGAGTLLAGEYETEVFEPAFFFRVGEGWEEMVIVTAEAAEDDFEGFLPEAQEVLDTVEWGSR